MTSKMKKRVDDLLVQHGFAKDRGDAVRLLLAGKVSLSNRRLSHAGEHIAHDAAFHVKIAKQSYVGRGGLKLKALLDALKISVSGKRCLDLGISTGGFTDCLLQEGAQSVLGIDVGYGQVDYSLQKNPRVTLMERCNVMTVDLSGILVSMEIVVADLSFISLKKVMTKLSVEVGDKKHRNIVLIFLVKPQFEVKRHQISTGGIVTSEENRLESVEKVIAHGRALGWGDGQCLPSSITGRKGNQEYFVCWRWE